MDPHIFLKGFLVSSDLNDSLSLGVALGYIKTKRREVSRYNTVWYS